MQPNILYLKITNYLIVVSPEVLLQVRAGGEVLVAHGALVGFLPRVDSFVSYQVTYLYKFCDKWFYLRESSMASFIRARVRLEFVVDPVVLLQR